MYKRVSLLLRTLQHRTATIPGADKALDSGQRSFKNETIDEMLIFAMVLIKKDTGATPGTTA